MTKNTPFQASSVNSDFRHLLTKFSALRMEKVYSIPEVAVLFLVFMKVVELEKEYSENQEKALAYQKCLNTLLKKFNSTVELYKCEGMVEQLEKSLGQAFHHIGGKK